MQMQGQPMQMQGQPMQGQPMQGQPMMMQQPGGQMMMQQPGGQMMMPPQMQQPGTQVIVVQQEAVKVEAESKCCLCMDVPCGLTTLMVLEIFYVIYFVIMVSGFIALGALAKGIGSMPTCSYNMNGTCTRSNYMNTNNEAT